MNISETELNCKAVIIISDGVVNVGMNNKLSDIEKRSIIDFAAALDLKEKYIVIR